MSSAMPPQLITREITKSELRIQARIPVYLAGRRVDVDVMKRALAVDDFQCIQSVGHNLKGTGSSYGFRRITETGHLLESAAKAGNRAEIRTLLRDLGGYLQNIDPSVSHTNDDTVMTHGGGASARAGAVGINCIHENKDVLSH